MKTKLILTIGVSLVYLIGFTQLQPAIDKYSEQTKNTSYNPAGSGSNSSTGLVVQTDLGEECSMYLPDSFVEGTLTFRDNTVFSDRLYRLNIYTQQMEFVFDNDTAAIGNPDEVELLQMDGKNFIYADFILEDKLIKSFMEVLVEGDYKLLLLRCIKCTHREDASNFTNKSVEKYYLQKRYFISYRDATAKQIMLDRKDVSGKLQVPGKDIKQYMKDNRNHMKTESDLVDVITYCNAPGS